MLLSRRQVLAAGLAIAAMPKAVFAAEVQATGRIVPAFAAIDEVMQSLSARYEIPAASFAMIYRNRLVFSRGYAMGADPVQPDSLFRLASLSKPITSIAVMRLWQEGRVDLAAPVRTYLDLQPVAGQSADPRLDRVTVSDLLFHIGGMPSAYEGADPLYSDALVAQAVGGSLPVSHQDVMQYVTSQPLESDPGTRFSYSNYGYLLLGRVVEAVTGQSYEGYVRRILAPLGIDRMQIGEPFAAQHAPGEVSYAGAEVSPTVYDMSGRMVPTYYGGYNLHLNDANAGWIASAVDLARLLVALNMPGMLLGRQALHETFAMPPIGGTEAGEWFGRGWNVSQPLNLMNIAGSLPGTSTVIERRGNEIGWVALWSKREMQNPFLYQTAVVQAVNRTLATMTQWPDHDLFAGQHLVDIGYEGL